MFRVVKLLYNSGRQTGGRDPFEGREKISEGREKHSKQKKIIGIILIKNAMRVILFFARWVESSDFHN